MRRLRRSERSHFAPGQKAFCPGARTSPTGQTRVNAPGTLGQVGKFTPGTPKAHTCITNTLCLFGPRHPLVLVRRTMLHRMCHNA